MKVLDLFSGIGGFALGLERAGMETVAFCEFDAEARKVLENKWPDVPIYDDVRTLTKERLDNDGITNISVLCGGFPCQDISVAGNQAGISEGTRSGLWSECARLLGEIRPQYAIFENVTALLNGGGGDWFKRVLWDISEVGYDAEWHCISASELGAHHHRDRIWIVAYPNSNGREGGRIETEGAGASEGAASGAGVLAYPNGSQREGGGVSSGVQQNDSDTGSRGGDGKPCEDVAHTNGINRSADEREPNTRADGRDKPGGSGEDVADTSSKRQQGSGELEQSIFAAAYESRETVNAFSGGTPDIWKVEPDLGRVADGISRRSHRLKQLGNAVVPQIPEVIGRFIMEIENGA